MWVMTTRGFFSAVQHRDHPTRLLIRARSEGDIRNLKDLLPDSEPFALTHSDYEWRLDCTAAEWAAALAQMALEVDYPNFKNSIKDQAHKSAYMACWSALLKIEDKGRYMRQRDDTDGKCRECKRPLGKRHTVKCRVAAGDVWTIDCTPKKAKASKSKAKKGGKA